MRWKTLQLNGEPPPDPAPGGVPDAAGRPPLPVAAPALFERGAITRTFDTPDFRGITFFEIQARTIINKVPESSRMAFRWTINPYRGCSHACRYCQSGETPILMADGRTRPLAEVRVGDKIYGTVRDGNYRRYVVTEVLAHWQTVKPAYRVTLEDGTSLVASGDHRFLTNRGWKHVTGAWGGPLQRPHLTVQNKLIGTGGFAEPPKDTADYRRGYLCGMIRGDATVGVYACRRPSGKLDDIYQFRLALTDEEALDRTQDYLARLGVSVSEFCFAEASANRRRVGAIRTQSRDQVRFIQQLIQWPEVPTTDWRKGFLAGIFDAEGSCSRGVLRIANTDPEIIGWTVSSLEFLGFDVVIDRTRNPNGLCYVRFRGGLKERLWFFHSTDPAITRKRDMAGMALKSDAELRVTSIEPLGLDLPLYDITTGTGDFIANGVVSHNCFARNTHTYLDLDAGLDFDSKIVVKVNAPELIRKELAATKWRGEHIAMGTNVDCYQRAEGRYQLMPGILSALRDTANPFSILTKGTLILRDLELLEQAAEVTDVGLNVSVGSVDKELWRSIEPGTPAPHRRLGVCATLTEHGLRCGVLMGPVVPFLSDSPAQLEQTVKEIAAAGAVHVTPIVLHLRPGAREWFYAWLGEHHPGLVPRYRALYRSGAYAPRAYQQRITAQVANLARKYGIGQASPGQARSVSPRSPADRAASSHIPVSRERPDAAPEPARRPAGEQLTLL
ncbi:MAG TPA: intein-containing Rv2578c family radical SAM protein [Streptosporangiaceae bacterium]|jgi:DNA repair photolyase